MTFRPIVVAAVAVVCGATLFAADPAPPAATPPAASSPAAPAAAPAVEGDPLPAERGREGPETKVEGAKAREGTRWVSQRGYFTLVGDRATFTNDKGVPVVILENLNLERIVRTIEESRTVAEADKLEWLIDGTLTEFRGGNFLLITRSVLVARPGKAETAR